MSLARLVITAVSVEGRTKSAVARGYGISRFWVQTLVKRFHSEGEAAFEPQSPRPHHNPRAVGLEVEDQIIRLRKQLSKNGLDAGAETIAAHLATAGVGGPGSGGLYDLADHVRRGFVTPQPQKRPRSSTAFGLVHVFIENVIMIGFRFSTSNPPPGFGYLIFATITISAILTVIMTLRTPQTGADDEPGQDDHSGSLTLA